RRRRHTKFSRDWSSDVCSSDLPPSPPSPPGSISAAPASACTPGTQDEGVQQLANGLGSVRMCEITDSTLTSDIELSARRDEGVEIGRASCRERVIPMMKLVQDR